MVLLDYYRCKVMNETILGRVASFLEEGECCVDLILLHEMEQSA